MVLGADQNFKKMPLSMRKRASIIKEGVSKSVIEAKKRRVALNLLNENIPTLCIISKTAVSYGSLMRIKAARDVKDAATLQVLLNPVGIPAGAGRQLSEVADSRILTHMRNAARGGLRLIRLVC